MSAAHRVPTASLMTFDGPNIPVGARLIGRQSNEAADSATRFPSRLRERNSTFAHCFFAAFRIAPRSAAGSRIVSCSLTPYRCVSVAHKFE